MISSNNSANGFYTEFKRILGIVFLLTLVSCGQAKHHLIHLPDALKEVSGIFWISHAELAMIEDEHGIIYLWDACNDKVNHKIEFADDGDYEDLIFTGDEFWILRSDGALFQVVEPFSDDPQTIKHKTPLSEKNDCEGLSFDANQNALYILCKEQPFIDKDSKKETKRSIYKYSIENEKLIEEPHFVFDTKDISTEEIGPSALLIEDEIMLILDSKSSSILVFIADEFSHQVMLDAKTYPQPEGLSLNEHKLYISSEAGSKGNAGTVGWMHLREVIEK